MVLGFGQHELGHHDSRRRAHHARGHEVFGNLDARAGVVATDQHDVGGHHAAGDGGESADHDAHDLRAGHAGDERLHGERRFGLAKEDVGSSGKCFRAADSHRAAQARREHRDHALHQTDVVEHRHERGEEDDDGKDLDREDESPRARGVGGVAEDELGAFVGEGDDFGHARGEGVEDRDDWRELGEQIGDGELHRDADDDGATVDGAAVGRKQDAEGEDGEDAQKASELLPRILLHG